ncbi:MAG: LacI family DNA-binding transcriptional regulator [Opitutales bacterium]|nr:LacI family DNA-binding transcriptional regulator [Opitutales bacterium]
MFATQKDVAARAKVTQAVVSAVLRDDTSKVRCSEAIRKKILRVARELNYRPNPGASIMRKRRTRILGLLFSNPHSFPFIPTRLYTGVVRSAARRGYYVSLIHDPHAAAGGGDYALPMSFRELHVDGYLMMHTGALAPALRKALNDPSVRSVFLNDDRPTNAVLPDDREGGRMAVRHAFEKGYRRPLFLFTLDPEETRHHSTAHRWEGVCEAVRAEGREPRRLEIPLAGTDPDTDTALRSILAEPSASRPDCLIGATDHIAVRAIHTLQRHGCRVPAEMGVIAFNDDLIGALSPIPLTSIALDWLRLAEVAVGRLVQLVEGRADTPPLPADVVPVSLIPRLSTDRGGHSGAQP